jgi:hypothetical protein
MEVSIAGQVGGKGAACLVHPRCQWANRINLLFTLLATYKPTASLSSSLVSKTARQLVPGPQTFLE